MKLTHPADLEENYLNIGKIPEHNLVSAIMIRGLVDYILVILYREHNLSTSYQYTEIKTSIPWIKKSTSPFSAKKCCEYLNLPYDLFLKYIKLIDENKDNLKFLKLELVKFNGNTKSL